MSYTSKTVTTRSDELAFVKKFMDAFAAASDKIVLNTNDIDTQFATSTNIPDLEFTVCTGVKLVLTRSAKLSTSTASYIVKLCFSGGTPATTEKSIAFASANTAYGTTAQRSWKVSVAENSGGIHIRLGNYNADMRNPVSSVARVVDILVINDGTSIAYGYCPITTSRTSVMSGTFYLSGTEPVAVAPVNRMPYTHSSGTLVGHLAAKVFTVSGTTDRAFTTSAIEDCSTIGSEQLFFAGGKKYYSIDPYTLMEV